MQLYFVTLMMLAAAAPSYGSSNLVCAEVECPLEASTCSIKMAVKQMPRRNVTTVTCYDNNRSAVLVKTNEKMLKEHSIPLPVVECGGLSCAPGAFNCTSLTTPSLQTVPPTETKHLVCRDLKGVVIEEREASRSLTPLEATGEKPPSCEGRLCPSGSRSCSYDTSIRLQPFKKTTHVVCYDIKSNILLEANFTS